MSKVAATFDEDDKLMYDFVRNGGIQMDPAVFKSVVELLKQGKRS